LSEIIDGHSDIPAEKLIYFRSRLSNRFHALVLSEFSKLETNKAELARRIGRAPEQITRWLGSPGNWTFDTLSDLLLGLGLEPVVSARSVKEAATPQPVEEESEHPLTPLFVTSAAGTPAANDELPALFGPSLPKNSQQAASANALQTAFA
jgi:hypothetical protein